jgi:hypothetical protein
LNLATTSGIWAITVSGICPLRLSSLNVLAGVETAAVAVAAVAAGNSLFQLISPITPSAFKPLACCHSFTLISVTAPKEPSAFSPNLA